MGWMEQQLDWIEGLRWRLLDWYGQHQRDLPWRHSRDPYSIWVSEIMLQQTRVAAVVERYEAFLSRFPTLQALAAAPEQDVLALWSGLGYYRRARMLHKAAQFVVENHAGRLPATAADLRLLPGIGAYTAAAIASIAHGQRVAVVDGNVERVLCRMYGWDAPARTGQAALRRALQQEADRLVDPRRPGDFNQAIMELGATVCTPRNPRCLACPFAPDCRTRGEHKTVPRARMLSEEIACALALRESTPSGLSGREVLLEQRPAELTVMPGLWQLPALREVDVPDAELRMTVRHAIMQTNYYVRVRTVPEQEVDALTVPGGKRCWVSPVQAAGMALTGLARKVLNRARLLPTAHLQVIAGQVDLEVS
ncbi:MAG TPA: A/G-specific adenine glycosylase [Terracidiphilus sp.]|nr:A/G-specific adenine glycosylase [Terracidiphilus sp.]